MYYFPIIELIERLIKKAGAFGSRLYWAWLVVTSLTGAIGLQVMFESGVYEARFILAAFFYLWIGLGYPMYRYEKNWEANRNKKQTNIRGE